MAYHGIPNYPKDDYLTFPEYRGKTPSEILSQHGGALGDMVFAPLVASTTFNQWLCSYRFGLGAKVNCHKVSSAYDCSCHSQVPEIIDMNDPDSEFAEISKHIFTGSGRCVGYTTIRRNPPTTLVRQATGMEQAFHAGPNPIDFHELHVVIPDDPMIKEVAKLVDETSRLENNVFSVRATTLKDAGEKLSAILFVAHERVTERNKGNSGASYGKLMSDAISQWASDITLSDGEQSELVKWLKTLKKP